MIESDNRAIASTQAAHSESLGSRRGCAAGEALFCTVPGHRGAPSSKMNDRRRHTELILSAAVAPCLPVICRWNEVGHSGIAAHKKT